MPAAERRTSAIVVVVAPMANTSLDHAALRLPTDPHGAESLPPPDTDDVRSIPESGRQHARLPSRRSSARASPAPAALAPYPSPSLSPAPAPAGESSNVSPTNPAQAQAQVPAPGSRPATAAGPTSTSAELERMLVRMEPSLTLADLAVSYGPDGRMFNGAELSSSSRSST